MVPDSPAREMGVTVGACPACGCEIGLGSEPWLGARVTCPGCGAYLEIIALAPVELDWAYDLPEGGLKYDYKLSDNRDQW